MQDPGDVEGIRAFGDKLWSPVLPTWSGECKRSSLSLVWLSKLSRLNSHNFYDSILVRRVNGVINSQFEPSPYLVQCVHCGFLPNYQDLLHPGPHVVSVPSGLLQLARSIIECAQDYNLGEQSISWKVWISTIIAAPLLGVMLWWFHLVKHFIVLENVFCPQRVEHQSGAPEMLNVALNCPATILELITPGSQLESDVTQAFRVLRIRTV